MSVVIGHAYYMWEGLCGGLLLQDMMPFANFHDFLRQSQAYLKFLVLNDPESRVAPMGAMQPWMRSLTAPQLCRAGQLGVSPIYRGGRALKIYDLLAELTGILPCPSFEGAGKYRRVGVAQLLRDLTDRKMRLGEQFAGATQALGGHDQVVGGLQLLQPPGQGSGRHQQLPRHAGQCRVVRARCLQYGIDAQ